MEILLKNLFPKKFCLTFFIFGREPKKNLFFILGFRLEKALNDTPRKNLLHFSYPASGNPAIWRDFEEKFGEFYFPKSLSFSFPVFIFGREQKTFPDQTAKEFLKFIW